MRISDWSPDVCSSDLIGLEHGKTEAWYVLSATPDAKIAIGLRRQVTAPQLRASIDDGSISDLVQWHPVSKDDVIFVPAGTIHARSEERRVGKGWVSTWRSRGYADH